MVKCLKYEAEKFHSSYCPDKLLFLGRTSKISDIRNLCISFLIFAMPYARQY